MSAIKKKPIDWEAVELQYRAGIRSLKAIGAEFGVSDAGIIKRAKRDDWKRDLRAKIHAMAEAKVSAALVSATVSPQTKIAEKQVIEAGSDQLAAVRLDHRKDICRSRRITNTLLDELEKQSDPETLVMLEQLGEMLRLEDDKGQDKKNDLYNKIISLGERSKTMKTLAESLRILVDMERTAYSMDKETEKKDDPLTALLHAISTVNSSGFAPQPIDPEKHKASTQSAFKPVQRPDEDD